MAPPTAVTYELPYLAAFRVATEGARMRAVDIWLRFMGPIFLVAAILLLAVAMLLTSSMA